MQNRAHFLSQVFNVSGSEWRSSSVSDGGRKIHYFRYIYIKLLLEQHLRTCVPLKYDLMNQKLIVLSTYQLAILVFLECINRIY